jgi:hypothetical protein
MREMAMEKHPSLFLLQRGLPRKKLYKIDTWIDPWQVSRFDFRDLLLRAFIGGSTLLKK